MHVSVQRPPPRALLLERSRVRQRQVHEVRLPLTDGRRSQVACWEGIDGINGINGINGITAALASSDEPRNRLKLNFLATTNEQSA